MYKVLLCSFHIQPVHVLHFLVLIFHVYRCETNFLSQANLYTNCMNVNDTNKEVRQGSIVKSLMSRLFHYEADLLNLNFRFICVSFTQD